jgi:hypothetical protein
MFYVLCYGPVRGIIRTWLRRLLAEKHIMQLNLPIFDRLADCRNILIAGMGGGFDVFSGLPIYFALPERGQRAHLANLTARTQGSTLWISPLMALYWFFELPAVAAHSQLLAQLSETNSFREAMRALMIAYRDTPKRPPRRIPLP